MSNVLWLISKGAQASQTVARIAPGSKNDLRNHPTAKTKALQLSNPPRISAQILLVLALAGSLPSAVATEPEDESLPLGASGIRAHTSHSRPSQSPAQVFERACKSIADNEYNGSSNGQDLERWKNHYEGKLLTHEDAYKAIDTILASRDPGRHLIKIDHSRFCDYHWEFHPKGTGVQISFDQQRQVIVRSIFADSSAAGDAVLLPGDIITNVDGKPTRNLPLKKVSDMIRGKPDTQVNLTILRHHKQKHAKLSRTWLDSAIGAAGILDTDIGYINVADLGHLRFMENFREALQSFAGATGGIIIDLRGGAGFFEFLSVLNVPKICDLFLDQGVTVIYSDRNGLHEEKASHSAEYRGRLVLLVDHLTEGGKELLCAALKQNNRAVLVGEATRGNVKRSKSIVEVNDDFQFFLDTAEYLMPDGSPFTQGVLPDNNVKTTQADYESGRGPWWYSQKSLPQTSDAVKDIQLKRAIEVLKAKV